MVRSTLFLTCFTLVLQHFGYLDWLDDLALKLIPTSEFEANVQPLAAQTMVLGLTSDFYEGEFGRHTPINREKFKRLLQQVLASYPEARVIALDYDLSPGSSTACKQKDDPVCQIVTLEEQQQRSLDEYLMHGVKPDLANPEKTIVLITPLPTLDGALASAGQAWVAKLQTANPQLRFGDSGLLFHPWFATVVKHLMVPIASEQQGVALPLAEQVNIASARLRNMQAALPSSDTVNMINFGQAPASVFLCPVWDWADVAQRCNQRLSALSKDKAHIRSVFIGALYDREDLYRTPLGDMYGVQIHAYNEFSQHCPVGNLGNVVSLLLDLCIGLISAMVFQVLWSGAARNPDQSAIRFAFICAVFIVLAGCAYIALLSAASMMSRGLWLNPLLILVGLSIDSYANVVERVAAHDHAEHTGHTLPPMYEFIGVSKDGKQLVSWTRPRGLQWFGFLFQWLKRIVFYWGVVLTAFVLLGAAVVSDWNQKDQCREYVSD